ncbi:MAG: DUF4178 domain-containing protein [Deltaproteobacteria bacterium]|nr:DUF4178 domain-containing protein [Deltaproteobacteria bacterium]
MKVACPTCGAEVEFRYDDSFVRVCDSCRSAVLRTDRGVDSLGKVADLTPIDSPLGLFAEGKHASGTFLLVGQAQIRHAAGGVWQEWYAKFGGGRWGWLAEGQGRFYLTFEVAVPADVVPRFDLIAPGDGVMLPVAGTMTAFTVSERGTASFISAAGEIPYRLEPTASFRFIDLATGLGDFATIDYGDDGDTPVVYIGRQVTLAQLGILGGEAIGQGEMRTASRLACPQCDGSLELRAPDLAMRVACPFCNHLISVEGGKLEILAKLAAKAVPTIALGSRGTFGGTELTVIGYVQRSAYADGVFWPFDEYLLYAPAVGFRWLVCSDSHWSFVQPIAAGAVEGVPPVYDGVTFKSFSNTYLRVDLVYGEFYWKIQPGELVLGEDYIAPPAMLSRESSGTEESFSLSTYMTPAAVKQAFMNGEPPIPPAHGVGANQVYPLRGWGWVAGLSMALLCALGIAKASASHGSSVLAQPITIKGAKEPQAAAPAKRENPYADIPGMEGFDAGYSFTYPSSTPKVPSPSEIVPTVEFTQPFTLAGGKNIEISLDSSGLNNNYAYAAIDLVNEATGEVISIDENLESYSGVEDGESWSEGDHRTSRVIGPVPAGEYVVRVDAQQGSYQDVTLYLTINQGVFRARYFWLAFLLLGIPFGIVAIHARSFEKRRWENANAVAWPPANASAPSNTTGYVNQLGEDDDE